MTLSSGPSHVVMGIVTVDPITEGGAGRGTSWTRLHPLFYSQIRNSYVLVTLKCNVYVVGGG